MLAFVFEFQQVVLHYFVPASVSRCAKPLGNLPTNPSGNLEKSCILTLITLIFTTLHRLLNLRRAPRHHPAGRYTMCPPGLSSILFPFHFHLPHPPNLLL